MRFVERVDEAATAVRIPVIAAKASGVKPDFDARRITCISSNSIGPRSIDRCASVGLVRIVAEKFLGGGLYVIEARVLGAPVFHKSIEAEPDQSTQQTYALRLNLKVAEGGRARDVACQRLK